ncbi:bacteriohemerythrin [Clostridium cylindrosporum]|uniref:Putative bacteriohemerythrin n=1 Tax=Clostridium cylindrosporum DSM 605 TaxID=1121307 RepID=A0A0J8DGM6_CLOCY|nr:hemerythrin family protein [Clostridium cylindrosporum]KMT23379.1 putative bacteriohemerythrin [Clostridium cylindrosporum DSM 605]
MLKWKDDYLIGVEEIDKQHEKIFEIGGRAYDLLKNDTYVDKYDKIVEVLEELKEYAIFHFKSEEEYLLSIRYKKFFSHKVEHDNFLKKVNDVDFNKIDEDQDAYLLSIIEFVINWTSEHILKNDRLFTEN